MANTNPVGSQAIPGQGSASVPSAGMQFDLSHLAGVQVSGMDREQILALLQSLPGNVLSNKVNICFDEYFDTRCRTSTPPFTLHLLHEFRMAETMSCYPSIHPVAPVRLVHARCHT